jgi:predicted O-methyltransferase YrrM
VTEAAPPATLEDLLRLGVDDNCLAELDGGLRIYEARGTRWLSSGPSAVQSALRLARPDSPLLPNHLAMALASALVRRPRRVLDLGTGCGVMLRFAASLMEAEEVVGVEAVPAMLAIARDYFSLPVQLRVVVADALEFLRACDAQDLVFCDVFDGSDEPHWLLGRDFCSALAAALAPGGAAAINLLPRSQRQLHDQLREVLDHFRGVGLLKPPGQDNVVLLLSQDQLPDAVRWRDLLEHRLRSPSACAMLLEHLRVIPSPDLRSA